jgi:hypothetical protein
MLHGLNHEKETSNVNVSGVHTEKTRSKTCGVAITTMVLLTIACSGFQLDQLFRHALRICESKHHDTLRFLNHTVVDDVAMHERKDEM